MTPSPRVTARRPPRAPWIGAASAPWRPPRDGVRTGRRTTRPGIQPKKTRPYRPQTNGKVERFHRTLTDGWTLARFYNSEHARRKALPVWPPTKRTPAPPGPTPAPGPTPPTPPPPPAGPSPLSTPPTPPAAKPSPSGTTSTTTADPTPQPAANRPSPA